MEPPRRKFTRRNLFGEWRQDQRARRVAETVERSRRERRPEETEPGVLSERAKPDPRDFTLHQWLEMHGTRTGTYTFNGVTYTDMNEVDWRIAHKVWKS